MSNANNTLSIIEITPQIPIFEMEYSIKNTLLNLEKDSFGNPANLSFSCNYQEKITIILHNNETSFSYYINADINNALLLYIENFIDKQKLTTKDRYNIFLLSQKLQFTSEQLNRLFVIIGWKNGKVGIDYFLSIQEFSKTLQEKYFTDKVGLKEAFFFHKTFVSGYDEFLLLFPTNLTLSETSNVLLYIVEIHKKKQIALFKISELLDFTTKTKLLESINTLRYPLYSRTLQKTNDYIKNLNLPSATKIEFDKSFENDKYTLTIDFTDIKNLSKKINKIKDICDKQINNKKLDLFIRKNLFKEDKDD